MLVELNVFELKRELKGSPHLLWPQGCRKHSEDEKKVGFVQGKHTQRLTLGKNNEIFLKLHKGPYVSYLHIF